MGRPLSIDLRERIVRSVEEGGTVRAVGSRFGVAPSSVSNISRLWRATESVAPKKMGGDYRSRRTEAHRERLLDLVAATPDLTLEEIQAKLREDRIEASYGALWRFFQRHKISYKKNRACRRTGTRRCGRGPGALERPAGAA